MLPMTASNPYPSQTGCSANLPCIFKALPGREPPGVYDIHSPRIPSAEEMKDLLERALQYIPKEQLWVNPDCGLKTRQWDEAYPSLKNMVSAALAVRASLQ